MDHDKQRFRLGAFVLGAAALLALLSVFFGGAPRFLQIRDKYIIEFDVAPGVVRGTPVRKSGVRIGEVEAVELDDVKGTVKVFITIEPKFSLRDNEVPRITPDLLSRDTTIDFVPKAPPQPPKPQTRNNGVQPAQFVQNQPKAEPGLVPAPGQGNKLPPGSVIKGIAPPDIRSVLQEATDVIPSVQQSISQISRSVARFEKIAPVLEETLREYADLARALHEMTPEIRRTNDELRLAIQKARELDPEVRRALDEIQDVVRQYKRVGERVDVLLQTNNDVIDKTIKNLQVVTTRLADFMSDENQKNFAASLKSMQGLARSLEGLAGQAQKETLPRFQDTLSKLDSVLFNVNKAVQPFADRSDKMSRNLDLAIERTAQTLGSLGDMFGQAGKADGTLQRFLTDPAVFNNLNDASLMLTRILPRVDRILKDLEVFADKIARHPETIGVGGVVKPSAGLKDPPGAPITNYKPKSP